MNIIKQMGTVIQKGLMSFSVELLIVETGGPDLFSILQVLHFNIKGCNKFFFLFPQTGHFSSINWKGKGM